MLNEKVKTIIKINNLKQKEFLESEYYFELIYTFSNGDFLQESLIESEEKRLFLINDSKSKITKIKLNLVKLNSYSVIKDLLFIKYEEYIDIYEFLNNNTSYIIKQKIIIDSIFPSICFNGYFIQTINQINGSIDILIQPNRIIKNYFRIYRMNDKGSFFLYKKLLINDNDEPGFIFVDEKNNNLLSFIEKSTDIKNMKSKSCIIKFDLPNYNLLNYIYLKDLKKFDSPYGYRQELKLYKNSFLFIHNQFIKIFCLDDLSKGYFQLVNTQKIKNYQCSSISHIDGSLIIAQSNDITGSKSFLKQYSLDEGTLELIEIGSIEVNGFIEDIFHYINGFILKINRLKESYKYIFLEQQ